MHQKFFLLVLAFLLNYCTSAPKKEIVKPDPYWQEVSAFLSGSEVSSANRFYSLTETSSYKSYVKLLDGYWNKIEKDYLVKIRPFRSEKMPAKSANNKAFYPLSGADFINLHEFYPSADGYIMVGLEPAGKITSPDSLAPDKLRTGLSSVESLIGEMAVQNYFTRKRMKREFANPYFSGTLPVLIFFMKRLGLEIDAVRKVTLNEKGEFTDLDWDAVSTNSNAIEGLRIFFRRPGDQNQRELVYFKMYISENSHELSTPEGQFFAKQGRLNLVMKSAEYVMQMAGYEKWCRDIIAKLDTVVEDDSAMPLRYFDSSGWNYKLFGYYAGRVPLQNTPNVPDQSDLKELIKKEGEVLPFKYGYGVLKGDSKSNLLILFRK